MNSANPHAVADAFTPQGSSFMWRPDILALHVISDSLLALAYFSIPFALLYFVRGRQNLQFNRVFAGFTLFMIACGCGHVLEIWVMWHPSYWLSGAVKAVTAVAAVPVAILLVRLLPAAASIPGQSALHDTQVKLLSEAIARSKAQEALRAANERLHREAARGWLAAIVESCDDAIVGKTCDGIITSWNRGAEKIFGYSQSEVLGRPMAMLFPEDRVCEETEILARIGRGERIACFESVRIRKDGARIDVAATISPVKDANGAIVGASKIARDITQRKRSEETMREQAEVLDLAQVIVRDLNGRITRWSRGAERLYGFTHEEALGRVSHDLLSTRLHEPLEMVEARLEAEGIWEGELFHKTRGGAEIVVASKWVMHRDADGNRSSILESNSDITDRKRAEVRLAAQNGRLALLNTITRAIGERQDLPSIFQVVLAALEDQLPVDFGCVCTYQSPDTLVVAAVGAKSQEFAAALGLPDQSQIPARANGFSRCIEGELLYEPNVLTVQLPLPGRLASIGVRGMVAAPLLLENSIFGVLIVGRFAPDSFSSGECEFLGQLSRHVALAAHQTQLYNALEVAYQDLRRSQQAVMRQEKLRVLGQMASGIAHDINNALSPAALYVECLIEGKSNPQDTRKYLGIVQGAIEGVSQTVARMKDFYSQRDPQQAHTAVSLNIVATRVIELTRARWDLKSQESGRAITVEAVLTPDLPPISGNESEIRDALTNLILNSVDAMPQGGRIVVRSSSPDPQHIRLEVADTGVGMDAATRNRCAELFFTTKGSRGTGLGLAMVYGMVDRHGGELQIDSEPNRGTRICMIFPAAKRPQELDHSIRRIARPQAPLRILVADDDPIILKSLLDALERDGHNVEVCDSGQQGMIAFQEACNRGRPFDVVVTDLGMPHMDGRAFAAAVKAVRPESKVVLLTGWGNRMVEENDRPPNVDCVLGKPPRMVILRSVLGELTNGAAA